MIERKLEPTFLDRFFSLPLVSATAESINDVYGRTKHRNPVLQFAMESSEKTVAFSVKQVLFIADRVGIIQRPRSPLEKINASACAMLDTVEAKLPLVTKSTEEIKSVLSENILVQGLQKVIGLPFSTVDTYNKYVHNGSEKVRSAKVRGSEKILRVIKPYEHIVHDTMANGLSTADHLLERLLPSEKVQNGNGIAHHANGTTVGNGYASNLDRAKYISKKNYSKLKRRLSNQFEERSSTVIRTIKVDGLIRHLHSITSTVRRMFNSVPFFNQHQNSTNNHFDKRQPSLPNYVLHKLRMSKTFESVVIQVCDLVDLVHDKVQRMGLYTAAERVKSYYSN